MGANLYKQFRESVKNTISRGAEADGFIVCPFNNPSYGGNHVR